MKTIITKILVSAVLFSASAHAISVAEYIAANGMPQVDNYGTLSLQDKGLTSLEGLETIDNADTVTTLDLSDNLLVQIPEQSFNNFTQLQRLSLSYNKLQIVHALAFAGLDQLERLLFAGNKLPLLPQQIFAPLINLRVLDLSYNQLQVLPEQIFANQNKLERLLIYNNILWDSQESFKARYCAHLPEVEIRYTEYRYILNTEYTAHNYQSLCLAAFEQEIDFTDLMTQLQTIRTQNVNNVLPALDINNNTVLHKAVIYRNSALLKECLRLWPWLLTLQNNHGKTALHCALELDTPDQVYEYAHLLLKSCIRPSILFSIQDHKGFTVADLVFAQNNIYLNKLFSCLN